MKTKYIQAFFFISLIFTFFKSEASKLTDEETQIITVKVPSEGGKIETAQMRITWKGYESHLTQWRFNQYLPIQSAPFSWTSENRTRVIYLDTGWSAIYNRHSNKPLPIIYTNFIYDCVGVGIIEQNPLLELKKVGILHRDHLQFLEVKTDDLSDFLSAFSPKNSKVSLVSGYASEHLEFVLHFIVGLGFQNIELTHLPCIRLPDPIDEDVSCSFLFQTKPTSLDIGKFDQGDGYQSLGFCPARKSFFLREHELEGDEFHPNIEEFDELERILRQAKEDPQITLGGGLKNLFR